jgi:hypothetical protein
MRWRIGREDTYRAGLLILERTSVRWEIKWLKTKNKWRVYKLTDRSGQGKARWWVRDKEVDPVFFDKEDLELAKGFAEAQLALKV